MLRRGSVAFVVVASVLVMNGCVVFQSTPTAVQQNVLGNVRITFSACASNNNGSPPAGSCTNTGNSSNTPNTAPSQLWVAFRVPKGTSAPASFSSSATGPSNTGSLTFTLSAAYTTELQRLSPASASETWIGYVSQYVSYNNASGEQNFTATVGFGLPAASNGVPFAGPFTYQVVVGGRQWTGSGTPAPNAGIDCEDSLTTAWGGGPESSQAWVCVDDQSPSTLGSDSFLATRDAGVTPGGPVSALPGHTATVPFTFGYAGPAPGASFSIHGAAPTLPGASASASAATITPTGTANTPVSVAVSIPNNAASGSYPVTLTAQLPDGEIRAGTATLTVSPACRVPKLTGKKLKRARKSLGNAGCKLGKVRGHGKRVKSQNPSAGTILSSGSKVGIKLGK